MQRTIEQSSNEALTVVESPVSDRGVTELPEPKSKFNLIPLALGLVVLLALFQEAFYLSTGTTTRVTMDSKVRLNVEGTHHGTNLGLLLLGGAPLAALWALELNTSRKRSAKLVPCVSDWTATPRIEQEYAMALSR